MEALEPVFTLLRVLLALAVVFGLIWFVGRRLAKRNHTLSRGRIRTVARQGLGPRQSVQLLDIDQTRYVLGIADHSVAVLDSYPVPEAERPTEQPAGESTDSFAQHLSAAQGEAPPGDQRAAGGSILSPTTWRQAVDAVRRGPQR